jgi:cysteine desulfurase family protein (TIGR01976 family)
MLLSPGDIRAQFPALSPEVAALDGAGGTQAPQAVIDAVAEALESAMSNVGGAFAASQVSGGMVDEARSALADLVGGVPDGVVLGPSMTALTFIIADTLSRSWGPGDEVVVTSLDHDANIRPWRLAAERAGATVRVADFDIETGELPVSAVDEVLSDKTKLVAVTAASNAIGTRPDVRAISDATHAAGGLVYVDGVHATPHVPTDVTELGADFYACSSYKFCGPHTGAVIADPTLLEELPPAKLVPASDNVPDRFERGTPPFELLAGVRAAVDWHAGLTDTPGDRRTRVLAGFAAIEDRLQGLLGQLVDGLSSIEGVRMLGAPRQRTSTVSFVLDGYAPREIATKLADDGVAVWNGDNYAYELMERFGLSESGGAIRVSIVLYSTAEEVDRLIEGVRAVAAGG